MIKILLKKNNLNLFLKNCKNEYAFDLITNNLLIMLFQEHFQRKNSPEEILIFKSSIDKLFKSNLKISRISNELKTSNTTNYSEEVLSIIQIVNFCKQKKSISEKIGPKSFIVHGLIGRGSFGEVYLVEKKNCEDDEGTLHAMKILDKRKLIDQNLIKYALTERNILEICKNPFIVGLDYAFQTSEKLILVLQFCPGGDLTEYLEKEKRFTEERTRIYMAEIIIALEDLHSKNIVYRDLKPDNVVLDNQGHAILTDFGLSKRGVLDHLDGAQSFCGSIAYLAPEMIKRCGHGKAVDWYLLGVLMHEMLLGIPPFYSNNREDIFFKITNQKLVLPNSLSESARSLLFALLEKNPAKRLGSGIRDADEIKEHNFFEKINWNDVQQKKLKPVKPQRKIKICTQINQDEIFGFQNLLNSDNYISGWSFSDNQIL